VDIRVSSCVSAVPIYCGKENKPKKRAQLVLVSFLFFYRSLCTGFGSNKYICETFDFLQFPSVSLRRLSDTTAGEDGRVLVKTGDGFVDPNGELYDGVTEIGRKALVGARVASCGSRISATFLASLCMPSAPTKLSIARLSCETTRQTVI
jgi:hypothetical protein